MAKSPKVVRLLNLLSPEEVSVLLTKLEKGRHHRLYSLTNALLNLNNQPLEKKAVYELLFDGIYNQEKDYLLRNEYRLLGQQIEWILAESEVNEQLEKNDTAFHFYLLLALQKRNALDLFRREYSTAYEKAIEHQDYYAAHNITGLNFANLTQYQNVKEKNISYLEHLNELGLTHLSCYYLTAFRQHQINHQYTSNHSLPFSTEESPLEKQVVVDFKNYKTNYSDYLFLKAKSFIVPLSEQQTVLQQCLERAEHHLVKNKLLFLEEVKFCLAALAKNQSLQTHFQKANQYYERYFDMSEDKDSPSFLMVMSDSIANQVNLNEINKAMQLLEDHQTAAYAIPKVKLRWQCLETACFAFLENRQQLFDSLRKEIDFPNVQTKYYFRFYHAVNAGLDGRKEDAYRELENLRHLTAGEKEGLNIHLIVNFFHRYYYTIYHHLEQSSNYQTNLKHLLEDVRKFAGMASPELRSYLPFLWLKRKLEET